MHRMRAALVIVGVLAVGCTPRTDSVASRPDDATAALERVVDELVNEHRRGQKLAPLALDPRLSDLARRHSAAMAGGKVPLGHDGFADRMAAVPDGPPSGFAENVAYGNGHADPAREIVQGWLQSRAHRRSIEGPYDRTGIGAARSPLGDLFVTQIFVASPQRRSR